jgi:hypothetical protein
LKLCGFCRGGKAFTLTDHCPEHARAEKPLVQLQPALAEGIFKALLRPCSETVERHRKASNADFRHNASTALSD